MIRRPVLHSSAFHTTLTATILQNATSTPGDSARLTSVELSEKATTRPTTASTPSALALTALAGGGDAVAAMLPRQPIRTAACGQTGIAAVRTSQPSSVMSTFCSIRTPPKPSSSSTRSQSTSRRSRWRASSGATK